MEQHPAPPKREWPKYLWGPDGRQARFDSPADIPRDYFPTVEQARAYAAEEAARAPVVVAAPAMGDDVEYAEFLAWKEKKARRLARAEQQE